MALRAVLGNKSSLSGLLSQWSSSSSHGRVCVSPVFVAQWRNSSSSPKIKVEFDQNTGVAVMRMQSPPINNLNLDFLAELRMGVETLEQDKRCRGIIITSSQPKVFAAGLDIMELYGKSQEHCAKVCRAYEEMWVKIYSSRMVTISAINGSSPAGACLMSLSCDYSIMADNPHYGIGLNETQLGLVPPFWCNDVMVNKVGYHNAEIALMLGKLFSPSEALKIGLVDQLAPEDEVFTTATQTMTKWLAIPDEARQKIKSTMRKPTIDKIVANTETSVQDFSNCVAKDSTQEILRLYLEMLKKRKSQRRE